MVDDYPHSGEATFGLQPVFLNLSREQKRLGYDVSVIARNHGNQPDYEDDLGVQVHRVENPYTVNALRLVRKLIAEKKRPIVHPHATTGVFMAPLRKVIRAPIVSQVHGTTRSHYMPITLRYGRIVYDYSPIKVAYYQSREKMLWSTANKIITVSNAIKSDLTVSYGFDPEKITVVYNGVNIKVFRPISDARLPEKFRAFEGKRIVLYVGHFGLRKGVLHLIKAMQKVTRQVPDSVLLCIGGVPAWLGSTDYWAYLKQAVKQADLEDKIILSDRIPNQELPNFYSLASVFVLPSYYEAFAKVVLEAMACGKPVVASKKGGLEEAIENGKSGFTFDFGNVDQLADAIITIMQDEKLAKNMGEIGRRRVERDFTWTAVANRIEAVYDQVCEAQWN